MPGDTSRFPSGVLVEQALNEARPVDTLVTFDGTLYRSTDPTVPTHVPIAGAAVEFDPANTRFVAESGTEYQTIEAALVGIPANTVIMVFPGVYVAPAAGWVVPVNVSIVGVTPPGLTRAATIEIDGSAVTAARIIQLQGNNVLANLRITFGNLVTAGAIRVFGSSTLLENIALVGDAASAAPAIGIESRLCEIRSLVAQGVMLCVLRALENTAAGVVLDGFSTNNNALAIPGASFLFEFEDLLTNPSILRNVQTGPTQTTGGGVRKLGDGHTVTLQGCMINAINEAVLATGAIRLLGCHLESLMTQTIIVNVTGGGPIEIAGTVIQGQVGAAPLAIALDSDAPGPAVNRLPSRWGAVTLAAGVDSTATIPEADIGGTAYVGFPAWATILTAAGDDLVITGTQWIGTDLVVTTLGTAAADRDIHWFVMGNGSVD